MDSKTTGIVAYITWIGLIVAFAAGDTEGAKFHLNQSLVIMIFSLLGLVPIIGWVWEVFVLVCWILGLVYAIQGEEKEVPLIGAIHIIK